MPKNLPFTIYNASAGSGKTYTLVKEYLKILFKSNNTDLFKRILAITFTNKAVAEMKSRILNSLYEFGNAAALGNYIAQKMIEYGNVDGSREQSDYSSYLEEHHWNDVHP